MSIADNLTNIAPDVLADPRVQSAIARADGNEAESPLAEIVTATPPDLSKYGIALRPVSLMQKTMLVRMLGSLKKHALTKIHETGMTVDIPDEYQPFLWTYTLAAPLTDVFKMLDTLDREGIAPVMSIVYQWFGSLNVPVDAENDILEAMANSLELALKALRRSPNDDVDEKKVSTGSSVSST